MNRIALKARIENHQLVVKKLVNGELVQVPRVELVRLWQAYHQGAK